MMYFIAALCGAIFGATFTVLVFALLTISSLQDGEDDSK